VSVLVSRSVHAPDRAVRRGPWLLVALHVPFVAAGPVMAIPRHDVAVETAALLVLVALAIGALQLRLSLATARGERAAGALWTFVAVAVLVYLPMPWFTWDWATMQWFVIASGAMALRVPAAVVVGAGIVVGQALVAGWYGFRGPGTDVRLVAVVMIYLFTLLCMGSAALYGSARLARALDDLSAARTELAELAVGRERLRLSRDLHDLLGQSLSAVSLKGDLALRLLPTDPAAARAEVESLTGVARGTLRDMRAVTQHEHEVSLAGEIQAAAALLGAAGIATTVDVELPDLAGPIEEVLAWAVREGATNALRHSAATTWSVTARRQAGRVALEIVNDGAPVPRGNGSGLAGLVVRAHAVSGSASATRSPDARFRLLVELPEGASP
jgi:two-component system, NarL family, sensor histidine kinase DesK